MVWTRRLGSLEKITIVQERWENVSTEPSYSLERVVIPLNQVWKKISGYQATKPLAVVELTASSSQAYQTTHRYPSNSPLLAAEDITEGGDGPSAIYAASRNNAGPTELEVFLFLAINNFLRAQYCIMKMLRFALVALFYCCLGGADADYEENPDNFVQFITRPDIVAFQWDIKTYYEDELQPGYYWFIAPYDNLFQKIFPRWNGPHIYDMNGELIWAGASRLDYINTYDFRMSEVDGQRMLSYIWSKIPGGHGQILNNSYELTTTVNMTGDSSSWDMHELNIINNGESALIVTYQNFHVTEVNLPEYSGPCRIAQQGFKEVEVNTGKVMFEWHTLDHISLEESILVNENSTLR